MIIDFGIERAKREHQSALCGQDPASMALTVSEAIGRAAVTLEAAGIDTARLDAEVLLGHIVRRNRAWLFAHGKEALDVRAAGSFEEAVRRREKREPLQYITGVREFWGLEFRVTPAVLIPRPETEFIIETALAATPVCRGPITVVDLCTGSGCIAVSLAKELPAARVIATDASERAIAVARENAQRHGVADRIFFAVGDLFEPLKGLPGSGQIDMIATNPPYVPLADRRSLQPEVRDFEPAQALFAGPGGTELAENIIRNAPAYLKRGGALIMEIGMGQADKLGKIIADTGSYDTSRTIKDLSGIERVIAAQRT